MYKLIGVDHVNFLGCFMVFDLAKLKGDLTKTNGSILQS